MAQRSKKAKFFCENCGAEVPRDAKFCRHCGRFFSSVRCPQCGTTGSPNKFINGCPVCGYAVGGSGGKKAEKSAGVAGAFLRGSVRKRNRTAQEEAPNSDDPLPFWLYLLIFATLILVLLLFLKFFL